MNVPVFLFTGFLESGKTSYVQYTLADPVFFENKNDTVLVLMCEEGEVELDPTGFASKNVYIEYIDEQRRLNPDKLESLRRKHNASRVIIEYNGMWLNKDLFEALPEDWYVAQEIMFSDSNTIELFNANMRNLVVDKLSTCDLAVFNRCSDDTDYQKLHKLVRGVSRRTNIVYEKTDGKSFFDEIEDPLPFDVNAPVINIEDRDYALFYRDLSENLKNYDGKTVSFLGQTGVNPRLPKGSFVVGRPIMTCCAEDIAFSGFFCENGGENLTNAGWVRITAVVNVKYSSVYGKKGPVLKCVEVNHASEPEEPVATFY